MRCCVDNGEKHHGVGELSVHPEVLVEREEPDLWPNKPHNCPADREQDEHPVDAQNQAGTSGYPHGILKCVEAGQALIRRLFVPEQQLSAQLLATLPVMTPGPPDVEMHTIHRRRCPSETPKRRSERRVWSLSAASSAARGVASCRPNPLLIPF